MLRKTGGGASTYAATLIAVSLLTFGGCGRTGSQDAGHRAGTAGRDEARATTHDQVTNLVAEAWERAREQAPYLAVRTGSLIRTLPDLSPEQADRDVAFARSMLERLDEITPEDLAPDDAITVAILRWDAERAIDFGPFYWLRFPYTPYQAGFALNFVHGQLAGHPFSEPSGHVDNYLTVLDEYADQLEQITAYVEGQMARDIYLSRHALPGVIGVFRSARERADAVFGVASDRLEALSDEQRTAFRRSRQAIVESRILPAFDALIALFDSDAYREQAPEEVGLAQYPDGAAFYRALVRYHTTTEVEPEALHALGEQRVAEIEARMAAIRREIGFDGTKADFHHLLRTDPRFFAESAEEVEARFATYIERIEPLVPDYFHHQPRAPYGVARLPAVAEASMTFGYYSAPTPNQTTGLYFYNGSALDERPQISAGPLIYHELIPGHHFHIALQSENERLPAYRREYLNATAFTEGWGNYGAHLAAEMGLLDDPYDRYGAALFDLFISARLVLDTGMNLLGWSLEQGRAYMREHTFQSETEIATETLRYATDLPGQALAYKAGLESLLALREEARSAAGNDWDIRDFHDAVLGSGAMPLVVLEEHVARTFADRRAASR